MDVDLNLQTQRPTRDESGNAIWPSYGARAGIPAESPIRFRHIALLVIGGMIIGGLVAPLICVPIRGITQSKFLLSAIFAICVYGSWIVGYHQLSQRLQWTDLRTRFAMVGK